MTTTRALSGPFDYLLPSELGSDIDVGSTLVVPFARRQVLGVVVGLASDSDVASEKLLAPLRSLQPGVPVELVELARWIAAEYCSTLARALTLVLPPGATRRLSGRKRRAPARVRHLPVGRSCPRPPELTSAQERVLESLRRALHERRFAQRLLQGVTGSGKTEIYLRAAATALAQDRGAIVLVPEIGLTPQIVGRFQERFGETVAVLHSRLRPGERYEEWRRLRSGEARVCVGPRSAVFAPVDRLGLIVIDEEHDASYKHEGDPRYDARDVALQRARMCRALLLHGSATPRPESVHAAGDAQRLRLPARVDGRPLPHVSVLDMREHSAGLHPLTAQALADARARRGKVIVLLNRRGWSNFLSCQACGEVWSCPHCDVALVLHRRAVAPAPASASAGTQLAGTEGAHVHGPATTFAESQRTAAGPAPMQHATSGPTLACHHCGHSEPVPRSCEKCGSVSVARHGAGTERVQHDLSAALDGDGRFPVFRLDADSFAAAACGTTAESAERGANTESAERGANAIAERLRRFQAADAGALIGTQMVAKGHDFPDVTLGVVLDADATLRFPDFRADERTFALIAQLAGRVGRAAEGRVLVQTIAPDARAIAHAAQHDSDGFVTGELERRRALCYPPFAHLIRIVCASHDPAPAHAAAGALVKQLSGAVPPGTSLLGPAVLFRLRGQERHMVVIKAPERRAVVSAVGEAVAMLARAREHRGVSFSVDVDPQ
ncbi:MAG TPA: primosomal protein N' [Solirubrobacteraceae bacterium]|nr:primosomal protein N' [Solirubrobacteraceae bacterium]